MAVYLLLKAKDQAILTAYTFDLLILRAALQEAAKRGVRVQVFVDHSHSMSGSTATQMDRLQDLRQQGVEVFLSTGVGGGGIQHSKTLLVDGLYIVGSTNWTNSSRSNHEVSILLELSAEGNSAVRQKLEYIKLNSTALTEAQIKSSQKLRDARKQSRGRSAEPSRSSEPDKYATARRYSIARARSKDVTRFQP